jgi:hypothetical protein
MNLLYTIHTDARKLLLSKTGCILTGARFGQDGMVPPLMQVQYGVCIVDWPSTERADDQQASKHLRLTSQALGAQTP